MRVLGRPGATRVDDADELLAQMAGRGAEGAGAAVVGTPDELVKAIRNLQDVTGGFGVVLGFAHDWANREATLRSWELFARFVVPEINGYTRGAAGLGGLPARQPERTDGRRDGGRDGEDPGRPEGRRGDGRHDEAGAGAGAGRRLAAGRCADGDGCGGREGVGR